MEVMKQLRQRAIRDLLGQRAIRTQQELAAALRERGFRATQATISRDVAELGLIKVSREGTQAYALPPRLIEAETSGEDRLRKLLADLPIEIHESGLLLVMRTLPGFRARDRRRPGPGPLARGRRDHRGRRHAVRRVPRSRLAPAHPATAAPPHGTVRMSRDAAADAAPAARSRLTLGRAAARICAGRTSGPVSVRGAWSSFHRRELARPVAITEGDPSAERSAQSIHRQLIGGYNAP